MRTLLFAALLLTTVALVPAPVAAVPPVCLVYDAEAGPASAEVWLTCGPEATVCVGRTACRTVAPR